MNNEKINQALKERTERIEISKKLDRLRDKEYFALHERDQERYLEGGPDEPESESEYRRLAAALLGREPEVAGLPCISLRNVDDPIPSNPGDLTDEDDQRIAAKCGIDPTAWAKLKTEQRIAWMGSIARFEVEAEHTPAKQQEKSKPEKRNKKLSLDQRALQILLEDPSQRKTDIAKRLECTVQNITKARCPKLHKAMDAFKARNIPPRGTKDKDRNVEAWGDDE